MKVEFLVENLENLLPMLTRFLPTHSQIPILSNLLLEAKKEGFFIYATTLEMGVRIKIPAKIEEEGATTVPGRQFIETIMSLPKDKATVSLDKDNLILKCRQNKAVFQTISREEFPNLFVEKGDEVYVFLKGEMRDFFSKLTFCVAPDESRPELSGILLSQKTNEIDFVATDGFRLSLRRAKNKKLLGDQEELILPARLISEITAIKPTDQVKMFIYRKANQVLFEVEDIVFVGRLISGEFPNYERVIPKSSKTKVEVDRQDFIQKLRLSSVFARESANIVRVKVEDGKMKIYAKSSGLGEGEAVVEAKKTGDDNEIAFNVKFLMDLLKNIEDQTVSMEISSAVEPAIFRTEEDRDFLHVIMPVRVQE